MKDEIKAARLAALFGLEAPKPPTAQEKAQKEEVSREAEAVIAFLDEPRGFVQRECRNCKHTFAVNRANISCCSDDCRAAVLLNVYGLEVDLSLRTPAERWAPSTGGREPLVIPPPILEVLPTQDQSQEQTA